MVSCQLHRTRAVDCFGRWIVIFTSGGRLRSPLSLRARGDVRSEEWILIPTSGGCLPSLQRFVTISCTVRGKLRG